MSSAKPTHYRLTPKALEDLEEIWRYTAETWSIAQADSYIDDLARVFEMLVAMPTLGPKRAEVTPPVRIHSHQGHLIVYTAGDAIILVFRLLGGRQNWQALLQAIES